MLVMLRVPILHPGSINAQKKEKKMDNDAKRLRIQNLLCLGHGYEDESYSSIIR